jgi:Icc-related predicted phosphoesterase
MRLIFISDTHNVPLQHPIPDGDILIHSGDATSRGSSKEIKIFAEWLNTLPHKHKIFVPGNHDLEFEERLYDFTDPLNVNGLVQRVNQQTKLLLSNVHVLCEDALEIDGIKFYGCSWQPEFCDWGFNLPRRSAKLKAAWAKIPQDTHVLITHTPPMGILDRTLYSREHVGCVDLASRLEELNVLIHAFGHIHESYGTLLSNNTVHINASTCNVRYEAVNKPVIVDVDQTDEGPKITYVDPEPYT